MANDASKTVVPEPNIKHMYNCSVLSHECELTYSLGCPAITPRQCLYFGDIAHTEFATVLGTKNDFVLLVKCFQICISVKIKCFVS